MDPGAVRKWRWFRWAAVPLAAVVTVGTYVIGFRLTNGAGASGEGPLLVLGAFLALATVLAAAVLLRLPLRHVAVRLVVVVAATVAGGFVVWVILLSLTVPACAAAATSTC